MSRPAPCWECIYAWGKMEITAKFQNIKMEAKKLNMFKSLCNHLCKTKLMAMPYKM